MCSSIPFLWLLDWPQFWHCFFCSIPFLLPFVKNLLFVVNLPVSVCLEFGRFVSVMIDTTYRSIPHVMFLGEQDEDSDIWVFVKADQSIMTAVYRKSPTWTIICILTLTLQRKASAVRQGHRERDNGSDGHHQVPLWDFLTWLDYLNI